MHVEAGAGEVGKFADCVCSGVFGLGVVGEGGEMTEESKLTSGQYKWMTEVIDALELIATKAERLVYNASALQDQFNPESYEVSADDLNALAESLVALDEIKEGDEGSKQRQVPGGG
jgi:hypothetical protein